MQINPIRNFVWDFKSSVKNRNFYCIFILMANHMGISNGVNNMTFSTPDIVIGILILIFCILGFAKGVIRQFFSILAFILASAASVIVPHFVKLPAMEGVSPIWGYIIFSILIWVPAFLIFNSLGKFIAKRMSKKGIKFSDRLWGLVFGGIKGFIIVILLIFFIDLLPGDIKQSVPFVSNIFNESKIVSVIEPYNPLLKLQIMQNLEAVISALTDPDYMNLLGNDPGFQKLKQNDSIKQILNDADLKKILEEHEYIKFMTHPKVQNLIQDPEAMKLLLKTDIDKAVVSNI